MIGAARPLALVLLRERDVDSGDNVAGHAVYQERFVPPLADCVSRRLLQQRMARPDVNIPNTTITIDKYVQHDRTLNAGLSGEWRIDWIDSGNEISLSVFRSQLEGGSSGHGF